MNQMDVDYVFVNTDLENDVDVWFQPLSGTNIPTGNCMHLKKALYGLKQTVRQRNTYINTYILTMVFIRLVSDACMYVLSLCRLRRYST